MKLEGEYIFDGPREEDWELLRDPEVLVTALPGAQDLERVGENEYEGNMHVRVGPVSGVFSGRIESRYWSASICTQSLSRAPEKQLLNATPAGSNR